jgi:hypothetical protein
MARASFSIALFLVLAFLLPAAAAPAEVPIRGNGNEQLAAAFQLPQLPQLPALGGSSVDWRQWDSFFTFVVKRFGQDVSGDLRDSLAEVFLDTRYELTATVARLRSGENPVPQLLVNAWSRLSPVMNSALPGLPQQSAERYRSFITAIDGLASAGQRGAQLGLLQVSPDALRGMARILEPSAGGDPIAYSVAVDAPLRDLVGLVALTPAPAPTQEPPKKQSRMPGLPWSSHAHAASSLWLGVALAAQAPSKRLNEWVPGSSDLEAYLLAVRTLLASLADQLAEKSKLPEERKPLYRQIIFAAGWQESCWRQYIKRGTPMISASGDLGLMQVNRNTWRNLYDLKQLSGDIEYNSHAGGEILLYYLNRYALRKAEDKQPGGHLARATYAAYNGGPSHLTRYRAAKQNPALKKVDEAFWEKFQTVSSGRELDVLRCYRQ